MIPELHRPIAVDRIGAAGLTIDVEASAAECAALARRMQISGIQGLRCRFQLKPEMGGVFVATGTLTARLIQMCVVSLEDFESTLRESFTLRFVPEASQTDDLDPESDDEIPYDQNMLDLGEAAAEQLALSLDPYPRRPDAELPVAEEEQTPHPFAALAALRQTK
jgi:uncharacterized metal-binding protein YceD (DUF177 family)